MPDTLNCNSGNYQCGGKCQPNTNKCPSVASKEVNPQINRFTNIINSLSDSINKEKNKKIKDNIRNELDKLSAELNNPKVNKKEDIINEIKDKVKYNDRLRELDDQLDNFFSGNSGNYSMEEILKERDEIETEIRNNFQKLILGGLKNKNGIKDPKEIEEKVNNFLERNNKKYKELPQDKQEEVANGLKIALENFGNLIDISEYKLDFFPDDFDYAQGENRPDEKKIYLKKDEFDKDIMIHELAHNIELDNPKILKDMENRINAIGVNNTDVDYGHEALNQINLKPDELIKEYGGKIIGYVKNGKVDLIATELITTFFELLAQEKINIYSLLNKEGKLKQHILLILEALL